MAKIEIKSNKTICFLGDSITADGRWIREIYQNLKTQMVRAYNCGIPGDNATNALERIYNDCLIYSPDYVVVMFGMNDVGRDLYFEDNEENEKNRALALEKYKNSMEEIIRILKKRRVEVILISPTPYDEVSNVEEKNYKCDLGLKKCRKININLAEKYSCHFIDFHSLVSNFIKDNIILPDRVHPNPKGQHLMAQFFMKEIGLIDEINLNVACVIDEENQKRFEFEQKLRTLEFVEWCAIIEERKRQNLTLDEKIQVAKSKAEVFKDNIYIINAINYYVENIHLKEVYLKEVIKYTV
jgi:lysophospholipase L1-like esterase